MCQAFGCLINVPGGSSGDGGPIWILMGLANTTLTKGPDNLLVLPFD